MMPRYVCRTCKKTAIIPMRSLSARPEDYRTCIYCGAHADMELQEAK